MIDQQRIEIATENGGAAGNGEPEVASGDMPANVIERLGGGSRQVDSSAPQGSQRRGAEASAADFFARPGGFFDEEDAMSAASEQGRGEAAGHAGADDDGIESFIRAKA